MKKPIPKKMVCFGGTILLLLIAGCYLLWNRVSSRIASQQQNAIPSSNQAYKSGTLPQLESGDAVGWLQNWQDSIKKNDPSIVRGSPLEVAQSLRNNVGSNEPFYANIRQILMDPSIDDVKKRELIFTLDRTATLASFQFLTELSRMNLSPSLKEAVLKAIANTGSYHWDKETIAQVSPALRQFWLQSEDPEILRSVAVAMAKIGDSLSVNALIDAVLSNSKSIADIEHSNNARVSAAWSALESLSSPEIVPTLQQKLLSNANTLEVSVSANLLAKMGDAGNMEARQALISWAQGVGDQYASIVQDAFSKLGTLDCKQYIEAALAQNLGFKSSTVKSVILSTLKP
jgi:hypothetical protein